MPKTLIVDAFGVNYSLLTDTSIAKLTLVRTVEAAKMTPLLDTLLIKHFPVPIDKRYSGDFGISGIMILVESHVSIHTWPERNYFHFELSSCKDFDPNPVLQVIQTIYNPVKIHHQIVDWANDA